MMQRVKYTITLICLVLFGGGEAGAQAYIQSRQHPVSTNAHNEIAPFLTKEGLVFQSDKPVGSLSRYENSIVDRPLLHTYISRYDDKGGWKNQEIFSDSITQINQYDFSVTFNINQDFMAFTRNTAGVDGRDRNQKMGIFFAENIDGVWRNIREFEHNRAEWMTVNPSLNATGNVMYFSSNRAGGFGGYDLYVSEFTNNRWTEPKNLGPVVNSAQDEIYPFIHPSGRLYFSSSGHDNVRDFDIFYSDFFDGRWFRPVKLLQPVNSARDEFSYYANEKLDYGFFTSNRRGTTDIYEFESTIPSFEVCKRQVENSYCYAFYEENTVMLDSSVYQYQWDLGDGTKVTSVEAEHCFAGPGDYLVQLNVVDKLTGIVEFNQAEYLVEVRKVIQPYISAPDTITVNEEIRLDGQESYFGDTVEGEYFWDFGDGNKAIGITASHTWLTPGTYQVKLGMIEQSEDTETARQFCAYKTVVVKEQM